MTAAESRRRRRQPGDQLRAVSVRIPSSVYDRYCRASIRSGESVRAIMCRVLVEPKKRGRASAIDPPRIVTVLLPASALRRYLKRARVTGEPIRQIVRRVLTNYPPVP